MSAWRETGRIPAPPETIPDAEFSPRREGKFPRLQRRDGTHAPELPRHRGGVVRRQSSNLIRKICSKKFAAASANFTLRTLDASVKLSSNYRVASTTSNP